MIVKSWARGCVLLSLVGPAGAREREEQPWAWDWSSGDKVYVVEFAHWGRRSSGPEVAMSGGSVRVRCRADGPRWKSGAWSVRCLVEEAWLAHGPSPDAAARAAQLARETIGRGVELVFRPDGRLFPVHAYQPSADGEWETDSVGGIDALMLEDALRTLAVPLPASVAGAELFIARAGRAGDPRRAARITEEGDLALIVAGGGDPPLGIAFYFDKARGHVVEVTRSYGYFSVGDTSQAEFGEFKRAWWVDPALPARPLGPFEVPRVSPTLQTGAQK